MWFFKKPTWYLTYRFHRKAWKETLYKKIKQELGVIGESRIFCRDLEPFSLGFFFTQTCKLIGRKSIIRFLISRYHQQLYIKYHDKSKYVNIDLWKSRFVKKNDSFSYIAFSRFLFPLRSEIAQYEWTFQT